MVHQQQRLQVAAKDHQKGAGGLERRRSKEDEGLSGSTGSLQWKKLRENRSYNHYKNMAG